MGIGILNWVQVALCDIKCVKLNKETVKILDDHFSYNQNLEQDKNFANIKIKNILKFWHI